MDLGVTEKTAKNKGEGLWMEKRERKG